ncbi:hypothetical protein Sjap_025015 [Stephania japonica]|uniref:tRNA (guanine(9)-N(1))-methyltransferase n=1 Tax=Stephania japonica TaxID=461633 RepID=A0AAP0E0V2_9MAGN
MNGRDPISATKHLHFSSFRAHITALSSPMAEPAPANDQTTLQNPPKDPPIPPLSKSAQKKLLKQQRLETKKAERKAAIKEHKQRELQRRRREWAEKMSSLPEEEQSKLLEGRRLAREERMAQRAKERGLKIERLARARELGQKIVVDLEFSDHMTGSEIHSLAQQIMYCYAVNGRTTSPAHLWLLGCKGEIGTQLQRVPGFDKWMIEKDDKSYIEVLQDQTENLVYLTADAETVLDELDPKSIYIIGGLVDRNRWKGITMKKANEQGIQTARLPIGSFLKMSSSQVLTVNQVFEILIKYLETKDWKTSFFQVIPSRKRSDAEVEEDSENEEQEDGHDQRKRICVEESSHDNKESIPA